MRLGDLMAPGGSPARTWIAPGSRVERLGREVAERGDIRVALLQGGEPATAAGFFRAVAASLEFPDYFGGNWDALDECLSDLAWIPEPAVLVVIRDADRLLANAPEDWRILLDILAAREMEIPARTLRLLLHAEHDAASHLLRNVGVTGHALPSFTL
jgi:RNAse (barnase) inhibitor barstar